MQASQLKSKMEVTNCNVITPCGIRRPPPYYVFQLSFATSSTNTSYPASVFWTPWYEGLVTIQDKQLVFLRVCRQRNHEARLLPFTLVTIRAARPNINHFIDRRVSRQSEAISHFEVRLSIGDNGIELGGTLLRKRRLQPLARFRSLGTVELSVILYDDDVNAGLAQVEKSKQNLWQWLWFENQSGLRIELHITTYIVRRNQTFEVLEIVEPS